MTASKELTGMAAAGLLEKTGDRRWTLWRLADDLAATGGTGEDSGLQPALWPGSAGSVTSAGIRPAIRRDRSTAIRALLADGPRDTREIADALGLTTQGVLRWLHRMDDVVPIEPRPGQRRLRWKLRD